VSNHVSILDHVAFYLATGSVGFSSQNAPILVQNAFRYKSFGKERIPVGEVIDIQPEGATTNGKVGLLK